MRILFAVNQYVPEPVTGPQRKILELSTRLAARGHSVTVLTRHPDTALPARETLAGPVHLIRWPRKAVPGILWPLWPSLSYRWAAAPLRELAKDHDCMVAYFPFTAWAAGAHPRLVTLTLTGGTVLGAGPFEEAGPASGWREGVSRSFFRRQLLRLERNCFRRSDRIIVETDIIRDQLTGRYGISPAQIEKIPSGVDAARFAAGERADGPCTVLYAGRLDPIKNVSHLLRAFALCSRVPDLRLVIAGDGRERASLERLAGQLGIADRTRFLGHVAAVEDCFRQADIFVLPSWYESHGQAALEAMAAGLPVLMLRSDRERYWISSEEIIREGENGFCSSPDDPRQMAEQIERLARDGDLRRQMGRAGQRFVRDHADWESITTRFETLIEELRKGKACRNRPAA